MTDMGMIYRVTVTAERTDGDYDSETLFELAGGAALIGRLAPSAVIEAVAQRTEQVRVDVPTGLAECVMDRAAEAGAPIDPFAGQPKRKRRTKAEIKADEEAVAAGFRDAAHRAQDEAAERETAHVAAGGEAVVATVPAEVAAPVVTTIFEGAAPVPPATASASEPGMAEANTATPPPAAPFNPFEVK